MLRSYESDDIKKQTKQNKNGEPENCDFSRKIGKNSKEVQNIGISSAFLLIEGNGNSNWFCKLTAS